MPVSSDSLKILPSVAIVSVTHNRRGPLLRLLSQIRDLDYPGELIEIFLLDGASTDGTVERVKKDFPEVHLTIAKNNLGIAAGFNAGIKEALNSEREFKYIWLLDSDVEVDRDTLMPLVEKSESETDIAVAGSAVYDPTQRDKLVTAGLYVRWEKANVTYNRPRGDDREGSFDVDLIPACSALTRAEVYKKIGLWDERFWLYWGDTEWCARSKKSGYRVCCVGRSRAWHRNWATVKADFYFPFILHDRVRSALLFTLLYGRKHSAAGVRNMILKSYVKAAFENLTLRPNYIRANEEGVNDFLRGFFLEKDFSSWFDISKLDKIDDICRALKGKIPDNPRIILNQVDGALGKEEIKEVFQKYFERIRWEEIPVKKNSGDADLLSDYSEYILYHLPRLLFYLLTFFKRRDLIVSPVYTPYIYNVAAARHTLLLNDSLCGYLREDRISRGLMNFFRILMKGLKVSFFDLPRALKNGSILKSDTSSE